MKLKKTEQSSIESKRGSLLLVGLTLASAVVLMSFEWSSFTLTRHNSLMGQDHAEDPIIVFTEIEIAKPMPKQENVQRWNDEVIITEEPLTITEPDPIPPSFDPPEAPVMLPPLPDDPKEPEIPDEPPTFVEKMPEFPEGMPELYKYLGESIDYPEISKDNYSQGRVTLQFTVEKDGTISSVVIAKGVDKFIDKEAIRVVEGMPKWTPGEQNFKKVAVRYYLPINFVLD